MSIRLTLLGTDFYLFLRVSLANWHSISHPRTTYLHSITRTLEPYFQGIKYLRLLSCFLTSEIEPDVTWSQANYPCFHFIPWETNLDLSLQTISPQLETKIHHLPKKTFTKKKEANSLGLVYLSCPWVSRSPIENFTTLLLFYNTWLAFCLPGAKTLAWLYLSPPLLTTMLTTFAIKQ